ncbi:hypothetical protein [Chloroflexus sp.]|uniref:HNH endonuclease n=1 Tax=Chloroflexus sp. TaxID=1904827 RepID=UPI002ACD9D81|nr:hypothetical protein [Chloroflexus sp.]
MERPSVPAMDELDAVLRDIEEMEEAIRVLKERVSQIPGEMSEQLGSDEARIAAARYLYWMTPDVPTQAIGYGLCGLGRNKLVELIGAAQVNIPCNRCKRPLLVRNRTHMLEITNAIKRGGRRFGRGYTFLCDACQKAMIEERYAWHQQIQQAQSERLRQLKTMPYAEYLASEEWKARRKRHLRSVGYRCQVCNTQGVVLDVHHRTYQRRGEEHYTDLLALCRTCHDLFHREGRLVK